ncbi:kelch domain-containing protein 9 [Ornithorhynchus anatinus]|uniref:Kelch domain containing 9 n=1 Tax=Ornithorhynchus anatinus TaxID=9258 RepID=A0A6I8PJ42_ORNAN|nr:kelch domain-containing protein 9 [Ornithorhynchus anatinus]
MAGAGGPGWAWRPVARDPLLARAFHSCTALRGRLYLVGGLLEGGARAPSGDTVTFDPKARRAEASGKEEAEARLGVEHEEAEARVGVEHEEAEALVGVEREDEDEARVGTEHEEDEARVGVEREDEDEARVGIEHEEDEARVGIEHEEDEARVGVEREDEDEARVGIEHEEDEDEARVGVEHEEAAAHAAVGRLRGGPRRSHHDAAAVGGRWLCVVGGWDGSRRVSGVWVLDAALGAWEAWAAGPRSRPPAGLSGHTCTRLDDRQLRVAGREGGTRTQRRYGSVYTLRLDPRARTYSYREEDCHTASRSGHCAALLRTPGSRPGHQLLLFGGCSSAEPDLAGQWGPGEIQEERTRAPRLTEGLSRLVSGARASRRGPGGLRYHSCSVVGPFAVLFGGESLTRARDTVCNDLYIYDTRPSPPSWFHFPSTDRGLKRVGHRTCLWDDQLYLVGGFGEDGRTPSPEVCTLELSA